MTTERWALLTWRILTNKNGLDNQSFEAICEILLLNQQNRIVNSARRLSRCFGKKIILPLGISPQDLLK